MKIKTIVRNTDWMQNFDEQVNAALADGWHLTKRDTVLSNNRVLFYAELVKLDPVPSPDEVAFCDPFDALRSVQEFCDSNKCESCALYDFCASHLPADEGPADWRLPEKEAPEA